MKINRFKKFVPHNIARAVRDLFLRFPITMLVTVAGTALSSYLVSDFSKMSDKIEYIGPALMVLALAFVVFALIQILSEDHKVSRLYQVLAQVATGASLVLYYFHLKGDGFDISFKQGLFFACLKAIFILLIFASPVAKKVSSAAVWAFDRTVVLRAFFAWLFSLIIFAGVSASFAAIQFLLGVDIELETYQIIGVIAFGIFGTWYLLAGVPKPNELEDKDHKVHKVLLFAVKYVLMPLLAFLGAVLYAYVFKILFTWTWPKEGVVWYILLYSAGGFAIFTLAYPLITNRAFDWVKKIFTGFLIGLYPLIILYLFAIGVRTYNYGFTVSRYAVILYGVWLVIMTTYYLFSKKKQLHWVFLSLAIAILVFWAGPVGAFSVSARSQIDRLETSLEEVGGLVDGKLVRLSDEVSYDEKEDIRSIFSYLTINHHEALMKWLRLDNLRFIDGPNSDNIPESSRNSYRLRNSFNSAMNVQAGKGIYENNRETGRFSFRSENTNHYNSVTSIQGADYLAIFRISDNSTATFSFGPNANDSFDFELNNNILSVKKVSDSSKWININLDPVFDQLYDVSYRDYSSMVYSNDQSFSVESDSISASLKVSTAAANRETDGSWEVTSMNVILKITEK